MTPSARPPCANDCSSDVVTSSRQAFDISEQRLREGTVDLVTVLQTQQTLYQAEDNLVQARLAHVQAIVSLYQALGGGWLPKPWKQPMHGEAAQTASGRKAKTASGAR